MCAVDALFQHMPNAQHSIAFWLHSNALQTANAVPAAAASSCVFRPCVSSVMLCSFQCSQACLSGGPSLLSGRLACSPLLTEACFSTLVNCQQTHSLMIATRFNTTHCMEQKMQVTIQYNDHGWRVRMCMCKCRTGNQMATAGADKVVKLWDPATGAHKASLRVSLVPFMHLSPWSVASAVLFFVVVHRTSLCFPGH